MRPIDADALVEELSKLRDSYMSTYGELRDGSYEKVMYYGKYTTLVETINDIKRHAPTIDYVPDLQGEWIHDINNLYGCSVCLGRETMSPKRMKKYCSFCGARMYRVEKDG